MLFPSVRPKLLAYSLVALSSVLVAHPPRARASDDLSSTALSIAPADAAFFSSSTNLADAWKDLADSNLVRRLRGVPFLKQLEAEFNQQWANPQGQLEQVKSTIENPNVRNLIKLGRNMMSEEMFVYGSSDWNGFMSGLYDIQRDMTEIMSGGPEAMEEFVMTLSKEDLDKIVIPTTVIGFRLPDDENARLQLDALEGIVRLAGGQIEQAKPFLRLLKRTDLEDGQTLAFSLDTTVIPMELLDEDQREMAAKAMELLEGRSLTIAMGVKANILLIGFGESGSLLETVGDSAENLLDHTAMSVLKEAQPENLRSISFVSQEFREGQWNMNFGSYFQRMSSQFAMAIAEEADSAENFQQWQAEIAQDATWLDEQVASMKPEFGPMVAWSSATGSGTEGYTYDWTANQNFVNAAPISVSEHAGSSPLLLACFKQSPIPELGEMFGYILENGPNHLRRFVELAESEESERERVNEIIDQSMPLLEEAFRIISGKIAPSLAENESLLAIAGKWGTTTLGPDLPEPEQPLPLPEMAIALKVSDREMFLEGCSDLFDLFDKVVEQVRSSDPEAVPPNYTVPRPEAEDVDGGTKFTYASLTESLPLPGFAPQMLINDECLVLAYSDRQAADMLEAKPLESRPGWMTTSTPVAAFSFVDFAGMVQSVRPWIEFGLSVADIGMEDPIAPVNGPIPTGSDILQIWDCFTSLGQAASTMTVSDSGPTKTRWVWVEE